MKWRITIGFLAVFSIAFQLKASCPSGVCASDGTVANIQSLNDSTAVDGDIITIPVGTFTWTTTLTITKGITLLGAGSISSTDKGVSTTGSDLTTIIDNHPTPGHHLIACGSITSGQRVRITGLAVASNGSSTQTQYGVISITGGTNQVRVDHCHFTITADGSAVIAVYGAGGLLLTGVIDHNFCDSAPGYGPTFVYLQNGYNQGDEEWAAADGFGTSRFIFVEDNRIRNSLLGDSNTGGQRFVYRYNTTFNETNDNSNPVTAYVANHGLTSNRRRSSRAFEYYGNVNTAPYPGLNKSPMPINGGTGLAWGNTVTQYRFVIGIDYTRKSNGTYPYGSPPTGWGNCDGTTGTVWDNASAYPALDQPGRGQGDLLNGSSTIATTVNTRTGTQAEVIQALSPIYAWANTLTPGGYSSVGIVGMSAPTALVQFNREVYRQFGTYGEPGTFNGSAGIGQGLLSARPSSGLTAGVGYWATDTQTLYVATNATTWVFKYTPYTYPHPMQSGSDTTPPTCSITTPSNNDPVSGTVTVSATANDDVAVAGVQFKRDTTNIGSEVTSSPYSVSWDTTTVPNGTHTLKATARDTSNNLGDSATITVTVSNGAPPVSGGPVPFVTN